MNNISLSAVNNMTVTGHFSMQPYIKPPNIHQNVTQYLLNVVYQIIAAFKALQGAKLEKPLNVGMKLCGI